MRGAEAPHAASFFLRLRDTPIGGSPAGGIARHRRQRQFDPPTTLREIKESHLFDDWALVRQSRLSTMPAPKPFVDWMRKKHGKSKI